MGHNQESSWIFNVRLTMKKKTNFYRANIKIETLSQSQRSTQSFFTDNRNWKMRECPNYSVKTDSESGRLSRVIGKTTTFGVLMIISEKQAVKTRWNAVCGNRSPVSATGLIMSSTTAASGWVDVPRGSVMADSPRAGKNDLQKKNEEA